MMRQYHLIRIGTIGSTYISGEYKNADGSFNGRVDGNILMDGWITIGTNGLT